MRLIILAFVSLLVGLIPYELRADFKEVSASLVVQKVLITRSDSLHPLLREPLLMLRDSSILITREIHQACYKFAHLQGLELVYTPGDKQCTPLAAYKSRHPKFSQNTFLVIGQGQIQLDELLQTSDVLLINPEPRGATVQCGCTTGNHSPSVQTISGSPQDSPTGTAITAIRFDATDADGDQLSRSYSYTFDSILTDGLPPGLTDSCTISAGALSCTVKGNAPADTGEYLITILVSDGSATGNAAASLTVTPVDQPDDIFNDSFELLP